MVTRTREGPRPSAARPPRLGPLVFVVGASALGAEIAAARLVAPHFGASTVIWANTIATVLLALALGYWLGGALADRAPHRRGLSRVIVVAAILLAAVPFAGGPLLEASAETLGTAGAGELVGSLLAIVLLVAPPVLLLGCVAPYALRLTVSDVQVAGSAAGRLYAISTLGSLIGVWLSALLLLPLVGTRLTFLAFALALAVVAAPGLLRPRW
ncbi:MAG: fused MFS/spermidine synthase [Solirubrobacteraceae bacterium]